jgi:hypothetical protein
MRNTLILVPAVSLAVIMMMPPTESAAKNVKISGLHDQAQIRQACDAVGGLYSGPSSTNNGNYGCTNTNKGTQVVCDKSGHCTGSVPASSPPGKGVSGVLGGARAGGGVTASGASTGKSGGPNKPVVGPVHTGGANTNQSTTGSGPEPRARSR